MKNTFISILLFALLTPHAIAKTYSLSSPNQSLVGEIQTISISENETTGRIAEEYNIGFNAISASNSWIQGDYRLHPGTVLKIPTQHLLPNETRNGIIINLPEMRLYYFPEQQSVVKTFPIGIGKIGQTIPIQNTTIVRKKKNPTWTPTESIHKFNLEQGVVLPKVIGPGPDNPLGQFAIYTGIPTYLIHSTPFHESIGKRASFGCIRMFSKDIEFDLFPEMKSGIPLFIINQPIKLGWQNDSLYMEAHPALNEHNDDHHNTLASVTQRILDQSGNRPVLVDWQLISYLIQGRDGIPHEIGIQTQRL